MSLHVAARSSPYRGGVARAPVPDEHVAWSVPYPGYAPVLYTAPGKWHEDIADLSFVSVVVCAFVLQSSDCTLMYGFAYRAINISFIISFFVMLLFRQENRV